jgi:hypothetical protein
MHGYDLVARVCRVDRNVVTSCTAINKSAAEGHAFDHPADTLQLREPLMQRFSQICSRGKLARFNHAVVCIETCEPARQIARCERIETLPLRHHARNVSVTELVVHSVRDVYLYCKCTATTATRPCFGG